MVPCPKLALLFAVSLAPVATGQAPATHSLEPGSRVRVTVFPDQASDLGSQQPYEGTLVAWARDTLFVRLHPHLGVLAVPRLWVDELWVSQGRRSRWAGAWRAGRTGFLLGAGLGAVVGSEVASTKNESGSAMLETMLTHAALYGLSLSVSGAFWGLAHPGERWKRIELAVLGSGFTVPRFGFAIVYRGRLPWHYTRSPPPNTRLKLTARVDCGMNLLQRAAA